MQTSSPTIGGALAAIGSVTALALSASVDRLNNGVTIRALSTNNAIVYVGPSGVTAANGYPLAAGDSVTVASVTASEIYAIAAAGTQELRWIGSN